MIRGLGPGLVGVVEDLVAVARADPVLIGVLVDDRGVAVVEPSGGWASQGVGEAADAGEFGGLMSVARSRNRPPASTDPSW